MLEEKNLKIIELKIRDTRIIYLHDVDFDEIESLDESKPHSVTFKFNQFVHIKTKMEKTEIVKLVEHVVAEFNGENG